MSSYCQYCNKNAMYGHECGDEQFYKEVIEGKCDTLTRWEAANEVVKAIDVLREVACKLDGHRELRIEMYEVAKKAEKIFYKHELEKELGFGI